LRDRKEIPGDRPVAGKIVAGVPHCVNVAVNCTFPGTMIRTLGFTRKTLVWAAVLFLLAAVVPRLAEAGVGSFQLRTGEVQEVSGGWHIFCQLSLPRAPSLAHTPMKFLFTKTVVYERALVDTSKDPVLNRTPLVNQTPSVESLDVDFSDPSGKIFNRTRFDFSLTRTRGYEAGEYKVQVRTADGTDIGSPATLILKGDNPVVDRRSITFNAEKKGIKKVDTGLDGGEKVASNEDTPAAAVNNGDVAPSGSAAPFISPDAFQKTPEEEIQTRPKGCGCSVPGIDRTTGVALLLGAPAIVGLAASRRRRRSRSRT
jgi:MYXO-CTERM domain-containing protein